MTNRVRRVSNNQAAVLFTNKDSHLCRSETERAIEKKYKKYRYQGNTVEEAILKLKRYLPEKMKTINYLEWKYSTTNIKRNKK